MISHLIIKNFAIMQDVRVDFKTGLNILTGETGSGKSIIIEAISLALGSRADTSYVRNGCDKAIIQMVIDSDEPIILTREIFSSGKSIAKINDELVTVSKLQENTKNWVNIHGQYDNQALLHPENHLTILDSCGKNELQYLKVRTADLYKQYTNLVHEYTSVKQNLSESERKRDFLSFERSEIKNAALVSGEEEELNAKLLILQNSEKIHSHLNQIDQAFSSESGVKDQLYHILSSIKEISSLSPDFEKWGQILTDFHYELDEISSHINRYTESLDFSPESIDVVIERLELIRKLKKKYGSSIDDILNYQKNIEKELDAVENHASTLEKYEEEIHQSYQSLLQAALNLNQLRKRLANELEAMINQELAELHFQNTSFSVSFSEKKDQQGHYLFSETGLDDVEFLIQTNKGESYKPLAKIASGGEISRIMLALKNIMGKHDQTPTLIFDEIDSGISGTAAAVVGLKLGEIAKDHQIICITHLPQIAAMGDHHYQISKYSDEDATYVTVIPLDEENIIKELAKLSGSFHLSDTAIQNAKDMLRDARETKKNLLSGSRVI